jgi:hypothetical protein
MKGNIGQQQPVETGEQFRNRQIETEPGTAEESRLSVTSMVENEGAAVGLMCLPGSEVAPPPGGDRGKFAVKPVCPEGTGAVAAQALDEFPDHRPAARIRKA